jgi:hypothetical protein
MSRSITVLKMSPYQEPHYVRAACRDRDDRPLGEWEGVVNKREERPGDWVEPPGD